MEIASKDTLREEFERLDITNAVMFALVMMRNPKLCKRVIEATIDRKVDEVDVITTESTIIAGINSKSVRLDALVSAGGESFDVEMQVAADDDIARRARYYHTMIDTKLLGKGEDYAALPDSYVIFIGTGPLLGESFDSAPVRTFQMRDTDTGQLLGDGATTVILDASAWEQANGELAEMLEFVERGEKASALDDKASIASALQGAVDEVKESEVDMAIMTAAAELDRLEKLSARKDQEIFELTLERDDAYNKGEAAGEARLAKLLVAMNIDNRSNELAEIAENPKRREELMREYGIE